MTNEKSIDSIIDNIQKRDRRQYRATFIVFGAIIIGILGAMTTVFLYLNKQLSIQEKTLNSYQQSLDTRFIGVEAQIKTQFDELEKSVKKKNQNLVEIYEKKLDELTSKLDTAVRKSLKKLDSKNRRELILVWRSLYSKFVLESDKNRKKLAALKNRLTQVIDEKTSNGESIEQIVKKQSEIQKKLDILAGQLKADKASNATLISGLRSKVNQLKTDASKLTQKVNKLSAKTPGQP